MRCKIRRMRHPTERCVACTKRSKRSAMEWRNRPQKGPVLWYCKDCAPKPEKE